MWNDISTYIRRVAKDTFEELKERQKPKDILRSYTSDEMACWSNASENIFSSLAHPKFLLMHFL